MLSNCVPAIKGSKHSIHSMNCLMQFVVDLKSAGVRRLKYSFVDTSFITGLNFLSILFPYSWIFERCQQKYGEVLHKQDTSMKATILLQRIHSRHHSASLTLLEGIIVSLDVKQHSFKPCPRNSEHHLKVFPIKVEPGLR